MLIKKFNLFSKTDPLWTKVILFSLSIFLVFFADAILSFWAPNLIEEKLGSASTMGLVVSFSSLVGLLVDMLLPSVLAGITARKLLIYSVITSIIFSLLLMLGISLPLILVFLVSMAVWGLYYEFIIFATQLFVVGNVPFRSHASAWAIIGVFKNLAYLLGPLLAGYLLRKGQIFPGIAAIVVVVLGISSAFVAGKRRQKEIEIDFKSVNIIAEFKKWKLLFTRVWPVILISLTVGIIDSTFWTTGVVYTEKLSHQGAFGGFFLSMYQLPSLFVGLMVARWGIYTGKKKLAETFLLLAGIFLILFKIEGGVFFALLTTFVSAIFLSFVYPLVDGVYSDVVDRMGKEKKHLIGFSSAAISTAYIIGPVISGFVTQIAGEKMTFTYAGVFTVIIALILLVTTPRKIKLPQEEIKKW